jgi:cold-inducible RNA-binding protein
MSNTKMYVGNLSFDASEQDLRELFGAHGGVTEVFMPIDRFSNRPRGFAFITMDSAEAMNAAISALNGQAFQGRPLTVNEARPQAAGGGGGGGGYGGGGGGGGKRGGGGYGGGGGGGGGGGRGRY